MAVGCRVVGDGISRFLGPGSEQGSSLLERLGMLLVIGQVGQLMGVVVDLKEFLRRARVGEYLALPRLGFTRGMSHP